MNLAEIEREVARLDAIYRPVATKPVDVDVVEPGAVENMATAVRAELTQLAVDDRAEAVLRALIELYNGSDETVRAAVAHLSARDQASDTRDEILTLQDLCARAHRAGIDVEPVLEEVAAMSSARDRYGMGSMRSVILDYGHRRTG